MQGSTITSAPAGVGGSAAAPPRAVGHVPMLEAPDRIATLIAEHVYASRTRLRAV
ncbi:hypothetical protein [Nocardia farcinica]|uniref:hypothetical protein n=1 Tax=Nocardia farcinica TaxID=37329 RepID=UPI003CC7CE23